jgi:hypothetical protein
MGTSSASVSSNAFEFGVQTRAAHAARNLSETSNELRCSETSSSAGTERDVPCAPLVGFASFFSSTVSECASTCAKGSKAQATSG